MIEILITMVCLFGTGIIFGIIQGKTCTTRKSQKMYRNLYINLSDNSFVYGTQEYLTTELAKHNQRCPPGHIWHSAIVCRTWV